MQDKVLSLGLVDGRNIWKTDLASALDIASRAADLHGPDRLQIAPSCSLLHSPVDLQQEDELDDDLRSWLAFAVQKLEEVAVLARAVREGARSLGVYFVLLSNNQNK